MKRILIIANGEGRGHLTQVLAFSKIIENSSEYEIVSTVLGTTENKKIPKYFEDKVNNLYKIETPQFYKNNDKSISLFKTFYKNLFNIKTFYNSASDIQKIVCENKPDIIINFYEIMTGIWNFRFKTNIPIVSIAHQYLLEHSIFKFPDNSFNRYGMFLINNLTSIGSKEKWCLSFYKTNDEKDLKIIPPLLREEIYNKKIENINYILVYLCNEGYLEDIKKIAIEHPLEFFKVYLNIDKQINLLENLSINPLSDVNFLNDISLCKGIMMSSGFESVCEAKYFNKPCLLVPIENHYEQYCNSFDAKNVNGGIYSKNFDYPLLENYIKNYNNDNIEYIKWLKKSNNKMICRLNSIFNK
jgi:uncharacterized protein (TIGR00661 family)